MDALKHASNMLSELRTPILTPKNYYQVYSTILDSLHHLSSYLHDAHLSRKHHLTDLYELVQYAGNIIPRLYLMITVGSVYMKVAKELTSSNKAKVVSAYQQQQQQPLTPLPTTSPLVSTDELANSAQDTGLKKVLPKPSEASGTDTGEENSETGRGTQKIDVALSMGKQKNFDQDESVLEEVPPVKELMRDMLDMSRGVQHPVRGLFLRYYLSQCTRDRIPDAEVEDPHGNIHDSIQFILSNFMEMNKLWVRLQFLGHSKERERREMERKELKLLIGTSLVRLSQLDMGADIYKSNVLPSLLEEVTSCYDPLAQEYLMEVIIQVFPDEFHLNTLDELLQATAELHPNVDIKQIVVSLINRFAEYVKSCKEEGKEGQQGDSNSTRSPTKSKSGVIPENVQLFQVFWGQIKKLIEARPDLCLADIGHLLSALLNLSLSAYPDRLDYLDLVFGFASNQILESLKASSHNSVFSAETSSVFQQILLTPLKTFGAATLQKLLALSSLPSKSNDQPKLLGGSYSHLLSLQPYVTRKQIALGLLKMLLSPVVGDASIPMLSSSITVPLLEDVTITMDSVESIDLVFGELISVLTKDSKDGNVYGPFPEYDYGPSAESTGQDQQQTQGITKAVSDMSIAPVKSLRMSSSTSVDSMQGSTTNVSDKKGTRDSSSKLKWADLVQEQLLVSQCIHLIWSYKLKKACTMVTSEQEQKTYVEGLGKEIMLLSALRKHLSSGGDLRMRFSLPVLVNRLTDVAKRFGKGIALKEDSFTELVNLFRFIHTTIYSLVKIQENVFVDESHMERGINSTQQQQAQHPQGQGQHLHEMRGLLPPSEMGLRLYLLGAKCADDIMNFLKLVGRLEGCHGLEEIAYEFFVQAFTIYEEHITDSKAQFNAITLFVAHLHSVNSFTPENFDTLASKTQVSATRLLKRVDQCRGVLLCASLWERHDLKRHSEALQRAIKIAESVMDVVVCCELLAEVAEQVGRVMGKNELVSSLCFLLFTMYVY